MHGRRFFVNAGWNLAGNFLPLCAGLVTIPILIADLGIERFGLLNLAWLLIGYFSLFDLGVGRALTKLLAEMLARNDQKNIPDLARTALGITSWLGVAAALFVALGAPWMIDWIRVSPETREEALISLWLLAASLPFVLLSAGWRGVLEAYGRFDWANWVRLPLGLAFFVAPLLVLPFSDGLPAVIGALACARIVAWWFFRRFGLKAIPEFANSKGIHREFLAPLLNFGGWITVSNVINPLMIYADRFLIGGLVSATAVAYYATSFEIVTRLWIIPIAFAGVIFPTIAGNLHADKSRAIFVYRCTVAIVALAMLPACALCALFANDGLTWWLGQDYAENGYRVAQLLSLGVFINAVGQVAISILHAAGRADWTAKLHVAELPIYLSVMIIAAHHYGIIGVALAWLARMIVDTVVIIFLAERVLGSDRRYALMLVGAITAAAASMVLMVVTVNDPGSRALVVFAVSIACAAALPRYLRALMRESGSQ